MGSETMMNSNGKIYEFDQENDVQKISVFNQIESDSFVVDMERLSSHQPEKDINANSRITLQRTLTRKASLRGSEKKSSDSIVSTSPRAALQGFCMPEKPAVVTIGATANGDHHPISPHVHNQITINTGTVTSNGSASPENKLGVKRVSFRRSSSHSWTMTPRRILIFFATLSSIGTLLLIYFTLTAGKLNADGVDALN